MVNFKRLTAISKASGDAIIEEEKHRSTLDEGEKSVARLFFLEGANWQKNNLWKDAQGDDLPEIDKEVIALQGRKVVFAHRPNPNGWDGKSLSTGEVEHYTPKTYDKSGWNMEGVTYWLDAPLPEGIG